MIIVKKISFTAAQLQTLNSVPIIILPAPPAGKCNVVLAGTVEFNYGTVAFVGPINLYIYNPSYLLVSPLNIANVIDKAQNVLQAVEKTGPSRTILSTTKFLQITSDADSAVGDSTMDLFIVYEERTIS